MTSYAPIVLGVRMSQYGYWVVDVSMSPDKTVSVMICQTGISPEQARELATLSLPDPNRRIPI